MSKNQLYSLVFACLFWERTSNVLPDTELTRYEALSWLISNGYSRKSSMALVRLFILSDKKLTKNRILQFIEEVKAYRQSIRKFA